MPSIQTRSFPNKLTATANISPITPTFDCIVSVGVLAPLALQPRQNNVLSMSLSELLSPGIHTIKAKLIPLVSLLETYAVMI